MADVIVSGTASWSNIIAPTDTALLTQSTLISMLKGPADRTEYLLQRIKNIPYRVARGTKGQYSGSSPAAPGVGLPSSVVFSLGNFDCSTETLAGDIVEVEACFEFSSNQGQWPFRWACGIGFGTTMTDYTMFSFSQLVTSFGATCNQSTSNNDQNHVLTTSFAKNVFVVPSNYVGTTTPLSASIWFWPFTSALQMVNPTAYSPTFTLKFFHV